jgi:hypothetical protein
MTRTYYRVVCRREADMDGAGLGYEDVYGDGPRYFWSPAEAARAAARLNGTGSADLRGTYSVEARHLRGDDDLDDEDDYARPQLGLVRGGDE